MDNCIIVQANEKCINKLMSYNTKFGVKVRIYLGGEVYCDICIPANILFKALYEAYKKGAGVNFNTFEDNARFHYFKNNKCVHHLSDTTMRGLIDLSQETGKYMSLQEIKDVQKRVGLQLESSFNVELCKKFNAVSAILKDFNRAKLELKVQVLSENKLKGQELQREV